MKVFLIFAAAAAEQPPVFLQFLPLIFLFFVFYFLLIRPQQKRQKAHAQLLAGLQKNDEVVTSGGIHGTIVTVHEKTLTLRIADGVKIEIEKHGIQQVKKSRK